MRAIFGGMLLLGVVACTGNHTSETQNFNAISDAVRKIVNGDISPGAYRNVGALRYRGKFLCSGTLIRPDVVLTAAHCIQFYDEVEDTGGSTLTEFTFTLEIGNSLEPNVTDYRIHPEYSAFLQQVVDVDTGTDTGAADDTIDVVLVPSGADLALLKLSKAIPDFEPWALGTKSSLASGDLMTAVGFGHDEREISGVRRTGLLELLGVTDAFIYDDSTLFSSEPKNDELLVVTAANSDEQQPCFGDSGGPLLKAGSSGTTIFGVLSLGDSAVPMEESGLKTECNRVENSYYTSLDEYITWINQQTNIMSPPGSCKANSDAFEGTGSTGGCLFKSAGVTFSKAANDGALVSNPIRMNRSAAISYCNELNEAGFSDWYLPTAAQLIQAAKDGAFDSLNLGDTGRFHWYWSQTDNTRRGLGVRLTDGLAYEGVYISHLSNLAVVCVRDI